MLKKLLNKVRNVPVRILARFNAASRSSDSMRNFSGTDYNSADAAMSRETRRLISARARNEFANNSFAYGIIFTLADDTIGTGPRLQLEPGDDQSMVAMTDPALQRREQRFHAWARQVKLNSILRFARIAKAVDGETFLWMQINPGSGREIPLEPRLYEAEYVASEMNYNALTDYYKTGQPVEVDGICYDKYGNPVEYRFHRVHPGHCSGSLPGNSQIVSASQVIHYANIFRGGQHRGLSEMTAALHIFNDLRRYSTAVVQAAEVAARLSFIISNDLPPELYESTVAYDEDGHVITALDRQEGPGLFVDGEKNALTLPAGYKASQLKSEQPTQNYVSFKDSKIAEAARVFSMPFNIAAGNSSSYNYASGRLDHQVYHKKLLIERETIGSEILDKIYASWEQYDSVLHPEDYLDFDGGAHSWMWDGFEHVDPIKEANAQAARLANGVTTMSEECAREGRDYHSILRQRKREIEECKRLGMGTLPWMNATGITMATGDDDAKKTADV